LTKNPLIYIVSHFTLGGLELCSGLLSPDVYFDNCINIPSQVEHRPLEHSSMITTSYVRR